MFLFFTERYNRLLEYYSCFDVWTIENGVRIGLL